MPPPVEPPAEVGTSHAPDDEEGDDVATHPQSSNAGVGTARYQQGGTKDDGGQNDGDTQSWCDLF